MVSVETLIRSSPFHYALVRTAADCTTTMGYSTPLIAGLQALVQIGVYPDIHTAGTC
jgi:hypothetical protein